MRTSKQQTRLDEWGDICAPPHAEISCSECKGGIADSDDRDHGENRKLSLHVCTDGQQYPDECCPWCMLVPYSEHHDHIQQAADEEHIQRPRHHGDDQPYALQQECDCEQQREIYPFLETHL